MSSDGSVPASKFRDGTSVLWGKFGKTVVGGLFIGFVLGVQGILAAIGGAVSWATGAFGSFLGSVLDLVVAEPGRILYGAFASGVGWLDVLGPVLPVIAVGAVGVYLIVWLGGDGE